MLQFTIQKQLKIQLIIQKAWGQSILSWLYSKYFTIFNHQCLIKQKILISFTYGFKSSLLYLRHINFKIINQLFSMRLYCLVSELQNDVRKQSWKLGHPKLTKSDFIVNTLIHLEAMQLQEYNFDHLIYEKSYLIAIRIQRKIYS